MESSLLVIAISTAIIAVVALTRLVFLIILGTAMRKEVKLLSGSVEEKVSNFNKSWRELLNLSSLETVERSDISTRILPKVLRSFIFASALWKNFQKRR